MLVVQVEHAFHQESVTTFAGLCGDNNPLHIDPVFAASTMFKGPIVHGILVSSLFSALFGRTVHGSIYVSQNLKFKRPVMVGAAVIARMEVIESKPTSKGAMLSCKTLVYLKEGNKAISELKTAVEGDAVVLVPSKA
jgi:acyl dehydratase